jgi:precorrin-2 dehydrogenase/sirohydrochlorin ferrochelatase
MPVMAKYPIFLELRGRKAVVIGGGAVAARKVRSLLAAEADVTIVARNISKPFDGLTRRSGARLIAGRYSKRHLKGATVAIAATNDSGLNERIHQDCKALGILCNVVDEPKLCDFFVPAVVQRGDLQIAISTSGRSPAYAGHIRKTLERIFTSNHGRFVRELEKVRMQIMEHVSRPADRKVIMGQLVEDRSFEYFRRNGAAAWRKRALATMRALRR